VYAFQEEFENGGDGIKLGSFRVKLANVALKAVCEAGPNDERKFVIIRQS
jgi:hypothetical protein